MNKIITKIFNIDAIKFLMVGGCATLIDFVFYILISLRLHTIIAKLISMLISSAFSYLLNKNWTFENKEKTNKKYIIKYYIAFVINVGVNTGTNFCVLNITGVKVYAFVVATGTAMLINFLIQKFFVFKGEKL